MTEKGSWYRSLSAPSQILLLVFLALCLFFGVGLVREFRTYMGRKAALEDAQTRLAEALKKEERLTDVLDSIDMEKERLVRQGYEALPGETIYQVNRESGLQEVPLVYEVDATRPVWQQWVDLFFERKEQ